MKKSRVFCVIASRLPAAKQSPVYQSKVKSFHVGFNLLIKAIFFFLEPPLIESTPKA